MAKRLKDFYYYVYFNAYWTNFDFGEYDIPRQNAVYYMFFVKFFILGALYALAKFFFSIDFPGFIVMPVIALSVFFLNEKMLSKEVFDNKLKEYAFIKKKTKRFRILLFTFVFFVAVAIWLLSTWLLLEYKDW